MKNFITLFLFSALFLISGYHAVNATEKTSATTMTKAPEFTTKEITSQPSTTTNIPSTSSSTTEKSKTSPVVTIPNNSPVLTLVENPEAGDWNASSNGSTILVRMAVQLYVTYNNTQNNSTNVTLDLPKIANASANGFFTPLSESIKLSWKSNGTGENYILLNFNKYNKTKTYDLDSVEVSIAPEYLPKIDSNSTLKLFHKQNHFNTSLDNSYQCVRMQNFNLTKDDGSTVGSMKVTKLQFQAFRNDKKFVVAEDCAFDTPDVVPIAVGCILAGLVVIILVGYLITRRRSQARGYLSM